MSLAVHAVDGIECTSASELVRAGFDGCEWFASRKNPMSALEQAEAFCRCARPLPTLIHAVSVRLIPEEIKEAGESIRRILPRLSDCGVRWLNLEPWPHAPSPGERRFDGYPQVYNCAHDLLKEIRFDAEAWGVKIAVSTSSAGFPGSPVELRDLIDAAASWAIGVCVDTLDMHRTDQAQDWVKTLGRRAFAVRANFLAPGDKAFEMKLDAFRFDDWENWLTSIGFEGILIHRSTSSQ